MFPAVALHCFKVGRSALEAYIKKLSYNRPWRPIGLWDVEAPTFSLGNRLRDGDEFLSLTRRPPFSPQEDFWYTFLLEALSLNVSQPYGPSRSVAGTAFPLFLPLPMVYMSITCGQFYR
jgi:hypothetical protein